MSLQVELLVCKRDRQFEAHALLRGKVGEERFDARIAGVFGHGSRGRFEHIEGLAWRSSEQIRDLTADSRQVEWQMITDQVMKFDDPSPVDVLTNSRTQGLGVVFSMRNDFPNQVDGLRRTDWGKEFVDLAARAWDNPKLDMQMLFTNGMRDLTERPWPWDFETVDPHLAVLTREEAERKAELELQSLLNEQQMKGFGAWA